MKRNALTLLSLVCLLAAIIMAVLYFTRPKAIVSNAVIGQTVAPITTAGEVIQWTSLDGSGFTVQWAGASPCRETNLHGSGDTPVRCTVTSTGGRFEYQIVPDHLPPPPPSPGPPVQGPTVVVTPCKPCKI